ncbi:MAG: ABC transporter substrate-binding protein [Spirochaetales bacterium]|nr:ABC transporter substrate-binding protein [Spirochaetales bacterium]
MSKKLLIVLALIISCTFVWAGGGQEEAPAGDAEAGGVVVDEWEIPFLNVLTGPIASIGEYLQWGAERAAWEINEAGGIAGKPVKIGRIDTGMSPEQGTVEMSKLVDSALVVMGPVPEPVIMAAVPIAAEEGLYSFTATTSFEYAAEYFPWALSYFPPTDEKLPPIIQAWAENVGAKKVVQFVENYGVWAGMAAAHVQGITDAGAVVLNDVEVPGDAITFGPLVVKALEQEPDAIIFACNAEKVAKIIIELKNRGWEDMAKLLVFSSADDAPLYTTGGDKIEGVMVYNYSDPSFTTPRWKAFRQAFKDDHDGIEPFSLSPNYYDAVYMIKRAIEETGVTGDPKKLEEERILIRDYVNDISNFDGLQFNWDNRGGYPANKPTYLFQIKNGVKVKIAEIIPE